MAGVDVRNDLGSARLYFCWAGDNVCVRDILPNVAHQAHTTAEHTPGILHEYRVVCEERRKELKEQVEFSGLSRALRAIRRIT